ncbi:MAG: RNA polymerase sigma-70 factor [Ginsengibacter sp.]
MSSQIFNEQDFICRLKENDSEAFKILYEKYAPGLHSFCSRFRFTHEETEEIIQETFIRIWQNRHTIDSFKPFNTFLIAIAKNLIYNQIRHTRYMNIYVKELKETGNESVDPPSIEGELRQIIGSGLQLLPVRCREVFKRSKLEGFSNQDIANDLNISKSTVENQLNKGLRLMRTHLKSQGLV